MAILGENFIPGEAFGFRVQTILFVTPTTPSEGVTPTGGNRSATEPVDSNTTWEEQESYLASRLNDRIHPPGSVVVPNNQPSQDQT